MKQVLLAALLGCVAFAASGCNCTCQYLHCLKQQLCCCDPCCDPCGGHSCDCALPPCDCPDCAPPPCACGHGGCADCLPSLGCLDCCSQGCGERYYGDWFVGDCDPCDCHGNWVGPSRYHGHPVGHPAGRPIGPHDPITPGPRVIGSRPKESLPTPVERR